MKKLINILFFLLTTVSFAQSVTDTLVLGSVSYKSTQNIYVKFDNTDGINVGDTLFVKINSDLIPAVIVNSKSSTSCAGQSMDDINLELNEKIFARAIIVIENKEQVPDAVIGISTMNPGTQVVNPIKKFKIDSVKSKLSGRISIQSYSNISNMSRSLNYQRWRYTFQLNANYIAGSNLSYSQYINFAYRASDWSSISSDLFKAIRVYDLALKYNFGKFSSVWLGRHLNSKISNISAVDGIQFEQAISTWSFGLVAGSRPDFNNMELNIKLFEYGGYVNKTDNYAEGSMSNTLSYFVQTNDYKTDRRFIYVQHSSSVIPLTRLFLSSEIDLYKKEMGVGKGDISLTSLFASVNIRASDAFSFMFSYDARKNVIYYETFKSIADSIYENETRQGFRTRVTLRPIGNLYLGGNYGYRFRPGDIKPSHNYGGYITYSSIPWIKMSSTVSYLYLTTNYLKGTVFGAQVSKPITYGLDLTLDYRNTRYEFNNAVEDLRQQSASVNLFISLLRPVSLNLAYEGIFEKVRTSGRFLANLTYRF